MAGAGERDDFGPTWVLLRPLPESDAHPGTPTVRMRRALKALLRGYGIRVERITAVGPDGKRVEDLGDQAADGPS